MNTALTYLLVADDEAAHVEAIRRTLEKEPLELRTVGTLREYRACVAERAPDIALVDLNLPDGRAVEILTSPPEAAPFPVVVMTAYGNQPTVVEVLKAGALNYFVKSPVTFATLPSTLELVLREWQLLQTHHRTELITAARLRLIQFSEAHSVDELLQNLLDKLEGLTGSQMGFYHLVLPDQKTLSLQSWSTHTISEMNRAEGKERHYDSSEAGVWEDCMRERRPVVYNDTAMLPPRQGLPPGHAPVTRELVVPVLRGDKIVAILGLGNKPLNYTDEDVAIVAQLADVAWDIFERKRAEEELSASVRDLTNLKKAIDEHDIVAITDPQGVLTYVNDRFCALSKYSREELIGQNPRVLNSGYHPKGFIRNLWETISHDRIWKGKFRNRAKDGSIFWLDTTIVPFLDAQGKPYQYMAIRSDITELKQVEEALLESKERLNFALQEVQIGAWELNLKDHTSQRTLIHDQIFGYEALLQNWTYEMFLEHVLPEDRYEVDESFRKAQEARSRWNFECRIRRADGEVRWIWAAGGHQVDSTGLPTKITGIVQDITERKRAEENLNTAKEAAEAANGAKDQFIAVLSHELRTPLTPVLMTVSARETDTTLTAELREELSMIRRNLELETSLIDDLLDLNRLAHGKITLRLQHADLHDILRNMLEVCREDIKGHGLKLRLELSASQHTVNADGGRLQQVFWNLLKNATKFTPADGTITIRTSNSRAGIVRAEVADTGRGIAPEVIPSLFVAFEQGGMKTTEHSGGLGLGLAICKALVDLHGGKIWVESKGEYRGSTFFVELPIANGHPPTEVAAASARPATKWNPKVGDHDLRILLVEDNVDTVRILSRLLERAGCKVTTAQSVSAALTAAQEVRESEEKFDLLISDLGLPDGDGRDIMRELHDRDGLSGIAISGYGMEEDIEKSHAAGFSEHLTKPIQIQELQDAISAVVGSETT